MQTKGSVEPQRQLVMQIEIGMGTFNLFNLLNANLNEVGEHFK